jgi:hypothetical protein
MIAPFFDDLDDNQGQEEFNVYFWTNSVDSSIVEWDNVANGQTDENCPDCDKEKFQVVLTNPNSSSVRDGEIIFQYKEIHDLDDHGSTIGIESPNKNTGIEYLFNYTYLPNVPIIENSTSIRFNPQCTQNAVIDECGVCGGSGESTWYIDLDNDGFGDANAESKLSCNRPSNHVLYSNDIDDSCSCFSNDQSCFDSCGNCGGNDPSCMNLDESIIPNSYEVKTFPNPFNPIVSISFSIPIMQIASIDIFDIRGRKMETLTNKLYEPGQYLVEWNASVFPSSVYFISLTSSDIKITQKVLLLK